MRNTPLRLLAPCLIACAIAAKLPAQGPQTLAGEFRVPLHTMASDPLGGDYGLWAAGPDYKASFHDGFAFFPRRGPERDLVTWRWQTINVRRGNQELLVGSPRTHTTAWRHELRYDAVTEIYDVRPEGVEQSFVLEQPIGAGDVVVTARITGDLHAPTRPAAQQCLEFSDAERVVVRYGEAIAFDAVGTRTQVTTSFDGTYIRLTLAASFLENAVYPVTIDPLTSPVVDTLSGSSPILQTALGVDNSSTAGRVLVGYTRLFAGNDEDLVVLMKDKNFASVWPVFGDITTSWDTTRVDIAHVDGADRFTVAFQREYSATSRSIRLYFHQQVNTISNSGTLVQPNPPLGIRWEEPRVCGTRGISGKALVVFEEDTIAQPTSSTTTRALCMFAYPANGTLGTETDLDLSPGMLDDNEMPAVERVNEEPNTWTVVWRKRTIGGLYTIRVSKVDAGGTVLQNSVLLSNTDTVSDLAVAGSWRPSPNTASPMKGRHVLAWVNDDGSSQSVRTRRFGQDLTGPAYVEPVRTIATSSSQSYGDIQIAHDRITQSHAALTYSSTSSLFGKTALLARLGNSGGVTESHILASGAEDPNGLSVAFGEPGGMQRFYALYGFSQQAGSMSLAWRELSYDPNAGTSLYGNTCNQNSTIQANRLPLAGDQFFGIDVAPVGPSELVVYIVGFGQGLLPLTVLGFPVGCDLLVDPNGVVLVPQLHYGNSSTDTLPITLPDAPVFVGDLFVQAAVFSTSGSPFTTRGLMVQVR